MEIKKFQFLNRYLLVSMVWKGVFFILEYRKTHLPGLFCQKYEDEKKLPFFFIKTLD